MSIESLLNVDVDFYTPGAASGAWGDTGTDALKLSVRGRLSPSGGRQVFRKGQVVAVSTHDLMVLPADISPREYAMIKGQRYEILDVGEFPDHMELALEAHK